VFPADVVMAQNRFVPHARSRPAELMRFREVTPTMQSSWNSSRSLARACRKASGTSPTCWRRPKRRTWRAGSPKLAFREFEFQRRVCGVQA